MEDLRIIWEATEDRWILVLDLFCWSLFFFVRSQIHKESFVYCMYLATYVNFNFKFTKSLEGESTQVFFVFSLLYVY